MRTEFFRNLRKLAICPAATMALGMWVCSAAAQEPVAQPTTATFSQTAAVNAAPYQPAPYQVASAEVAPVTYLQPPANDVNARLQALEQTVEQQQVVNEALRAQLDSYRKAPTDQFDPTKPYKLYSNKNMYGVWNNGLEFYSPGKEFYAHVGGRTQFDNIGLGSPNNAAAMTNIGSGSSGLQDATDFRRARLRMEGTLWGQIDYCMEYNFVNAFTAPSGTASSVPAVPSIGTGGVPDSNGNYSRTLQGALSNTVQPVDLWWNIREVPVLGNVQIGNMKEPFNLERLESSRYLDFLERNYAGDAFISPSANGFAPGIMAWNWSDNKRMTYAVGFFKNVTNGFAYNIGDGQDEVAGRVTWLPYYDQANNGRNFVHLGMGMCQRGVDNGLIRYRSRGDLRNGPDAVLPAWADTGFIGGEYQQILNPELMIQRGPLFIQAEYTGNWTQNATIFPGGAIPLNTSPVAAPGSATNVGSLYYWGGYIQAMYFLTGEHRIYDYQKALVGRVIPNENFFALRNSNRRILWGRGAWQVGYRANYLNLNDKNVRGGTLMGHTVGLNWFLNPNMKIQTDFDSMTRTAFSTTANQGTISAGTDTHGLILGVGTRVAVDF
jgi:phosphate-selective porin OprO/OprP